MGYSINVSNEISLIVLDNVPSDLCFMVGVFTSLAENNVNIDMISQSPAQGAISRLSFTLPDGELANAFKVISEYRETYKDLKFAVSSGNYKISVSGEEMRTQPGVAAKVFSAVAKAQADMRLITTAETEISMLISQPDSETVIAAINSAV